MQQGGGTVCAVPLGYGGENHLSPMEGGHFNGSADKTFQFPEDVCGGLSVCVCRTTPDPCNLIVIHSNVANPHHRADSNGDDPYL